MADSQQTTPFFDSLPYYDNDLEQHPILREKVQHELAVETQKLQQERLHPNLPPAFELFTNNPLLAAEMKRVEERRPLAAIDTTRYQLPAPTSTPASDEEWKAALDNAHAQLEHQRIRHNNLALLQQYGSNAWRIHNYTLEADAKSAEKLLEELKEQTTEVNRDRKNAQTRIGNQLTSLETRWTELISSVLQIEMANVALEVELDRLNKRETELAMAATVTRAQVASEDAFMENTDITTPGTPGLNGSAEVLGGVNGDGPPNGSTSDSAEATPNAIEHKVAEDAPQSVPAASHMTSLKGLGSAFMGGSSTAPAVSAPHPKRFSAVNINKKFLEKTHSAPGSSQTSSTSATPKSSSSAVKPTSQPTASHSRLVTTKLTASPQPSTTTGPGWSRPSSVAPSVAPSPGATGSPANATTSTPAPHGPPQLPVAGKVIQPQPRGASAASPKDAPNGSIKPVWGNLKGSMGGAGMTDSRVQNDFPTAAEVAQVRMARQIDKKQATAPVPAEQNPSMQQEAEAFRGVHLDPNAHHWDEMEEDNDDFLGGVIEFGDGRQYKIQPAESPQRRASPPGDSLTSPPSSARVPDAPVSKEERFADDNDYDRSWPRSRPSPTLSRPRNGAPLPGSAVSPTSSISPQEASRVLFNERSNRLEPYSNSHPRSGDARNGRDLPPHHNLQLLHRNGPERPRFPDSEQLRRDLPPSHGFDGRAPDRGRRASNSSFQLSPVSAHQELHREGGRQLPPHLASGGSPLAPQHHPLPHPLPPHPSSRRSATSREPWQQELARQDTSPVGSRVPHSPSLTRNSAISEGSPQSTTTPLVDVEEVRKAAMHSAAERARLRRQQEEEERDKERERARKKAAELEEKINAQKREKEEQEACERQAVQDKNEAQQTSATTTEPKPITPLPEKPPLVRTSSSRPTPADIDVAPRAWMTRTTSYRSAHANGPVTSPATEVESWRSKAAPLPPIATREPRPHPPPSIISPTTPLPPAPKIAEIEMLSLDPHEGLEEVDFSDMGKFVGAEEKPASELPPQPLSGRRPPRPVASDFFEDGVPPVAREPPAPSQGDVASTWRQKPSVSGEERPQVPPSTAQAEPGRDERLDAKPPVPSLSRASQGGCSGPTSPLRPHGWTEHPAGNPPFTQPGSVPPNHHLMRSPRITPAYREASMSTLDDTMSRIKGALAAQRESHKDAPGEGQKESKSAERVASPPPVTPPEKAEPPKSTKWLPPAMRPRLPGSQAQTHPQAHAHPRVQVHVQRLHTPPPDFLKTAAEPPDITIQAWKTFTVKLPKIQPREPLSKKQMHLWRLSPTPVRWEILSWDPPVEGMTRKDLSLNDVLFRRPQAFKGKVRYRVIFPKHRPGLKPSDSGDAANPKVNLPSKPVGSCSDGPSATASRDVDSLSNWRTKTPASSSATMHSDNLTVQQLETVSRSPPPDTGSDQAQGAAGKGIRTQPKMPAGAAVAFYRDSQVEGEQVKASVKFIVSSELEESEQPAAVQATSLSPDDPIITPSASAKTERPGQAPIGSEVKSPSANRKADSTLPESSNEQPSPQPSSTSWTKPSSSSFVKDSPSRVPDPEQLKRLWSQTSPKAEIKGVNSLEAIADDLTVPFTLQEVKSEDGETPPPVAPHGPSRMSLHDVTRAFQQVPSPPAGSSTQKPTPTPSSLSNSSNHQSNYPPPSGHAQGMRPAYPGYPSPMMSHSPAPVMYPQVMTPSPVAGSVMVNGPSSPYGHPVWMPVQSSGPPAPGTMMRPIPSPYPTQYMSYPSPGGPPAMYAASPATMVQGGPPPQVQQGQQKPAPNGQGRGRGHPVMSPVMSHAG
ncbi:hypothetical protein EVG20_g5289, partial [Dentipellis fragilis]